MSIESANKTIKGNVKCIYNDMTSKQKKKAKLWNKKKVGKNRESNIIAQYWLLASNWNFMVSFDKVN
jgi:hypothetical protein